MDASLKKIKQTGGVLLSKAIDRMRNNQVIRQEGYDGEFGVIRLFDDGELVYDPYQNRISSDYQSMVS